ncbi:NADH:flavin oxidoreductase/NADH oxidase [Plectosphaerella cucumerina]|uniref:NADH:flavin oxidoreductase/NADH oxidase n=1 Tax=Plectosphaerella cucumerina TaxID=40658 RepID=A0A8K0X1T9_9PEZI|nr:NADH:flavin oxidoreductase/NADH oxidase [Plectosphaerella cucumerina]
MSPTANTPAPGVGFYTPAQSPPAGTPVDAATAPTLFTPLRIRDVELTNRFIVSPMCQYSADNGHLTDWHLVHLGQFAISGAALTIVEATSVEPRGRISPEDSGLWQDSQIAPLKRIVDFIHSQGQKAGIQLAHAGRKASNLAPWLSGQSQRAHATVEEGGWPDDVVGPSAIPFAEGWPQPKELTIAEIEALIQSFADAARRAVEAGFDVIEIHGAHGYLLTEFLSPLSNQRTDDYGGSFENRTRFLLEIVKATRAVIPEGMPLFVRISATEWMEHAVDPSAAEQSWDLEQSIRLAKLLPDLGVDLLDVSSGGNNSAQKIELHKYYQVSLAGQIREALLKDGKKLLIGAVGMISEAEMARSIVQETGGAAKQATTVEIDEEHGQKTQADAVLVAREFLRDPHFVLNVARELNVPIKWPHQYERAPRKSHGKL